MSARLAGVALAVLLASAVGRAASPRPEVRARVQALLGSYRTVTVAQWQALGPEAAPVLEAEARDAQALPTWRARALAALGVVRPTAAAPLVRQLAPDATVPAVLRSAAVEVSPSVLGADAVGFLTPFLRDRDPVVRWRSAEALAGAGPAGCRTVLAEARTRPPSDPLARTAGACTEALKGPVAHPR